MLIKKQAFPNLYFDFQYFVAWPHIGVYIYKLLFYKIENALLSPYAFVSPLCITVLEPKSVRVRCTYTHYASWHPAAPEVSADTHGYIESWWDNQERRTWLDWRLWIVWLGKTLLAVLKCRLFLLSCCGVYLFGTFLLGLLTFEDLEELD